jgi:rhodanese-related sulfurtransferase
MKGEKAMTHYINEYSIHTLHRTNLLWSYTETKKIFVNFAKSSFIKVVLLLLFILLLATSVVAQANSSEDNDVGRITVEELMWIVNLKEPVVILDIRTEPDVMIKGAKHIPLAELDNRLNEIPKSKPVVIYCACPTEGSSIEAVESLLDMDYENVNALKGGIQAWIAAGGAVERKAISKVSAK